MVVDDTLGRLSICGGDVALGAVHISGLLFCRVNSFVTRFNDENNSNHSF